jgi:hypothetical protein
MIYSWSIYGEKWSLVSPTQKLQLCHLLAFCCTVHLSNVFVASLLKPFGCTRVDLLSGSLFCSFGRFAFYTNVVHVGLTITTLLYSFNLGSSIHFSLFDRDGFAYRWESTYEFYNFFHVSEEYLRCFCKISQALKSLWVVWAFS